MTFKDICLLAWRNNISVTIDTFGPEDELPRFRVECRKDGFHIVRTIHFEDIGNEEFISYIFDDLLWAIRKNEENTKLGLTTPEGCFERYINHDGKMVRVVQPTMREDEVSHHEPVS